jgi:uncharacterized protein
MSIEQDLRARLTAALKAKDLRTANVIRMITTRVTERRTSKGFSGEVDDALHLEIIGAYRKQMEKARQEYEAVGERGREQVAELQFEIDFCDEFLPRPLGDDEVRAAVRQVIAAQGIRDPKQAGRVVGGVMKEHKGRVEAARVKQIAEEELGG